MPRNTQTVEIDLRSGVVSNESLYAINQRLWKATNSVFDFRYPRLNGSAAGPWALRQPLTFANTSTTSYTSMQSFRDIGFHNNAFYTTRPRSMLFGANTSNQYSAWDGGTAAAVSFAGGVSRVTIGTTRDLGCSVYWQNPGKNPGTGGTIGAGTTGALIFGHALAAQVYYLMDDEATIKSLTADLTNCPTSACALAVHLDRLWIATNGAINGQIWYTDPFDLDSMRSTSVVQIPDFVTALVTGQFGAIDASGSPHLVIGGRDSVWVLDGDPQLGGGLQADLRALTVGVGIATPHAAATTPYGVFFLGSDGDVWHIPPGTQSISPVGQAVRNLLGVNPRTGTQDDYDGSSNAPHGSVVWFDPYLYVYPSGESSYCLIARPLDARGSLEWWGPVTMDSAITGREAIIRSPQFLFGVHANSALGRRSVHSVDALPVTGVTARYLVFDTRSAGTGSYPDGIRSGRTASIQTGLINIPRHELELNRVILETIKVPQISSADVDWTVTVTDERGNTATGSRGLVPAGTAVPPPTAGTYAQANIATQYFTFNHVPLPAARGLSITISCTAGADLGLVRAFAEVHTTPALR